MKIIAANHHHMKVTITLDGETEPIYESAGIMPGQYIEYVKLNRTLSAGTYSATALGLRLMIWKTYCRPVRQQPKLRLWPVLKRVTRKLSIKTNQRRKSMKKMKMVIPALALAASMSMTAFAAGEAQQGQAVDTASSNAFEAGTASTQVKVVYTKDVSQLSRNGSAQYYVCRAQHRRIYHAGGLRDHEQQRGTDPRERD